MAAAASLTAAAWQIESRSSVLGRLTFSPTAFWYIVAFETLTAVTFLGCALASGRRKPWSAPATAALWAVALVVIVSQVATLVQRTRRSTTRNAAASRGAIDRRLRNAARLVAAAEESHFLEQGRYGRTSELQIMGGVLPSGVVIDVQTSADQWTVIATDAKTAARCTLAKNQADEPTTSREGSTGEPKCSVANPAIHFGGHDATRSTLRPRTQSLSGEASGWEQYRKSAAKTARIDGSRAASWTVDLGNPFRATAAVARGRVVVGAHGSGVLAALDVTSGRLIWQTRVPNWIHQDPVIADTLVLVGFGDNRVILDENGVLEAGVGPSGVSAHALRSGRRMWAVAANASVMTSPLIVQQKVIYATGLRQLVARDLHTGRLLWQRAIPGRVVMGSPALSDSIIVVAQEDRVVCAYLVEDGGELWCFEFPAGFSYVGHSAPTIANGSVYVSALPDSSGWSMLSHRDMPGRAAWLREQLRGRSAHYGEQVLAALDVATGRPRWMARLGGGFPPYGHTSGTPVIDGERVYVVSPIAQAVVSLDARSGAILWRRSMPRPLRGPPSFIDESVVAADQGGLVSVLDAGTGRVRCAYQLPDGVDRAGPAIWERTLIFTGLRGKVMAVPFDSARTHC